MQRTFERSFSSLCFAVAALPAIASCTAQTLDGEGSDVTARAAQAPVTLLPTSDVANTSVWGGGGTPPIYQLVDDGVGFAASDGGRTFARSAPGATSASITFGYLGPSTPVTEVVVNHQSYAINQAAGTVTVRLYAGNTLVATGAARPLSGAPANFTERFTNLSLADASQLRTELRFQNTAGAGSLVTTQIWLELATDEAGEPPEGTPQTIVNDTVWRTVDGEPILAQGGNVTKVGDTYYWYGRDFDHGKNINCYSSQDLVNWKFERAVYSDSVSKNNRQKVNWLGRPTVIYHQASKQYVMVVEYNVGSRNRVAFLTSSSPTGDFYWRPEKNVTLPDGENPMGDQSVFVDDDGRAYLLFISDDTATNSHFKIAPLTPDYLGLEPVIHSCGYTTASGGNHEAATIIKHAGYYYLFSSETRGWLSSRTSYKRARSLSGFGCSGGDDWLGWTFVRTSPSSPNSYNTQHDFIITVRGTEQTSYVYAGDRWNNMKAEVGGVGRYGWYPLTFDANGVPTLNGHQRWSLDVVTGRWSP